MDETNSEAGDAGGTACAGCGKVAQAIPLTWVSSRENGETRYFCDTCARESIRAIEQRLDSSWW
jgi:protein-arginine kinase activator protein McsA